MMPSNHMVVLVLAAALAGACTGSDATSQTAPPTSEPGTTSPPTTNPIDPSTTTTAPTTTTTSAGDRIAALLQAFAATPVRATYVLGEGSDRVEVTISRDPTADPPLTAIIVPASGAKLITIGEQTIFCDTAASTCFQMAAKSQPSGPTGQMLGLVATILLGSTPVVPASFSGPIMEETVEPVGRRGLCFEFSPPSEAGIEAHQAIVCIDAEAGFVLRLDTVSAADDTRETIVIITDLAEPEPGDFEPNGPVEPPP